MNKIIRILSDYKYAIIWTICYIFAIWVILSFMFHFNIFNAMHWRYIARAGLHGFPGFVLGILILAAIPLYVSTTTLIIRTKQPLFSIPKPSWLKMPNLTKNQPTPSSQPSAPTQPDPQSTAPEQPRDIPIEIRSTFERAQRNVERIAAQYGTTTTPTTAPDTTNSDINDIIPEDFPIPTDFDINFDDTTPDDVPVFTEINFDSPSVPTTDNTPQSDTYHANDEKLQKHLTANGTNFTSDENVIITDTRAIVTHSDPDFWVIDTHDWFATGKTRPSPIELVTRIATKHNVQPCIYLESQNILDLEKLIPQWESDGITVYTNIDDIK